MKHFKNRPDIKFYVGTGGYQALKKILYLEENETKQ